ncbi:hypothetical protein QUF50_06755 [Thiotrichales bacterium HSG1]|nr:hypothetical protein [Thiotrichales bacterium HSG1]
MKHILIYFLTIISISSCVSNSTKENLGNLRFIDVDTFDQELSESMIANTETITVSMIGKVSVNAIPKRLGRWLSVVIAKDGQVDFKTTTKPKPVNERTTGSLPIGIIVGVLPTAYDFFKNEFSYGPAANYNAIIYYQSDSGLLEKLLFINK